MDVQKEIIQLGQSLAVIIPKNIAEKVGLQKGTVVDIMARKSKIQIKRLQAVEPIQLKGVIGTMGSTSRDFADVRKKIHGQFVKKWKNF